MRVNMEINSALDPISFQIETFKALVKEVNCIPGVQINLKTEADTQRDSLAFMVDAIYNQFKDTRWPLILKDLPFKVREWNTPPDALKASSSLLSFIRNLYEERVMEMSSNPEITLHEKERLKAILNLYSHCVDCILKNPIPGKPINIAGVSHSLLPEWYKTKQYLV